jgi:hypothetical protein
MHKLSILLTLFSWSSTLLALPPLSIQVKVRFTPSQLKEIRTQGELTFSTRQADVATLNYLGQKQTIKDPSIKVLREAYTNPDSSFILLGGPKLGNIEGFARVPSVYRLNQNDPLSLSINK